MDKSKKYIQPSYQIKYLKKRTSKYPNGQSRSSSGHLTPAKVPPGKRWNITRDAHKDTRTNAEGSDSSEIFSPDYLASNPLKTTFNTPKKAQSNLCEVWPYGCLNFK